MITNAANNKICDGELVFRVHGFLSKRLLMKPLEWQISRGGFRTRSWGYLSFYGSLEQHADRLRPILENLCRENDRVHLVAHSMGSIVLRLAMQAAPLPNLGRMVLLAPPNQGTPMAKLINPFLFWICKGVSELSSDPNSLVNQMEPPTALDFGIVAGRYDWIVPKSRTPLTGQSDHICLAATHNTMLVQPSVARQVVEFLRRGRFCKNDNDKSASD